MSTSATSLAIVMPVLDEAATLASRLAALQPLRERGVRIVVVDGGSADHSVAIARAGADRVLAAPRGRAAQMNAGAAACSAELLIFLHADTQLPDRADQVLLDAGVGVAGWGRFDVRLDGAHPMLRVVGGMMNWRSRLTGICTGDQAIFVGRELFERIGGFPDIALMEDIALSRELNRLAPPLCLRRQVTSSARRWEQHGVWRTVWLMWRLRAAYRLGADPQTLASRYGYRPRER